MPHREQKPKQLTAGEALYVLNRLIRAKRLGVAEINQLASEMHQEIEDLERRLATLRDAAGSTETGSRRHFKSGAKRSDQLPRGREMSAKLVESRRIQGEYMGLIRHVRGAARERIKQLAASQGRQAAIKEMRAAIKK